MNDSISKMPLGDTVMYTYAHVLFEVDILSQAVVIIRYLL